MINWVNQLIALLENDINGILKLKKSVRLSQMTQFHPQFMPNNNTICVLSTKCCSKQVMSFDKAVQKQMFLRRNVEVLSGVLRLNLKSSECYRILEKHIAKMAELFDGFHFDNNSVDFNEETSSLLRRAREIKPNILLLSKIENLSEKQTIKYLEKMGVNKVIVGLQEISGKVRRRSKYRRENGEMIIPNIMEQVYQFNKFEKMKIQRLPKVQIFEFHDLVI